ncbi:hypothetical protein DPMN_178980 [Dreissena polymorpha]|uniref:Uncharacterized protein n=1 Tax=Dreissena polymorpha TaxID=45954 RepID=A0A9D4ED71_DREPO|nr:hypothetical protein DPMN_178980 [Dreissena polymorpha]
MDLAVPDRPDLPGSEPGRTAMIRGLLGFERRRSFKDHHPDGNTVSTLTSPAATRRLRGLSRQSYGPTLQENG